MKKMLLSAAFLAAMTSVSAQKLTYVPYADNGYLMGTYISSDGRYIAGGDAGGQGFIYDTQNGQIKYFVSPENGDETKDASTEVRAVNPDGTGVGYVGDKLCKFDFNTGEYTDLGVNEPALANTMSTDGSVIGGFAWDESTYIQHPIYLKDGVKYDLPMPTSTWLGYEANGFGLTGANADGSMFLGYVQDDFAAYPICVWVLNQDGKTYSVIPVSKRFYDSSIELSGPQPMDYFNGAFMSANGRWVALSVHNKDNTEQVLHARPLRRPQRRPGVHLLPRGYADAGLLRHRHLRRRYDDRLHQRRDEQRPHGCDLPRWRHRGPSSLRGLPPGSRTGPARCQ